MKKTRILFTGGHAATTALAVVEEIRRRNQNFEIHWLGPKYAMDKDKVLALAPKVMAQAGVSVHYLVAGRLLRKVSLQTLLAILKFPLGFVYGIYYIVVLRPKLVLSFGGYAGFPVVVAAWLMRTPVVLHDQTYSFNRANVLSVRFAKRIAVSRSESLKYYPSDKTVLTGNPVMRQILAVSAKPKLAKVPTLFVMGGSSGSTPINRLVFGVLSELVSRYKVIHQTGPIDYQKALEVKSNLSGNPTRYKAYESINPDQMAKYYQVSDVIVSRAGANTISEILATKRPAILIPLVIGNWDEQKKNADYAKNFGIASILDQDAATGEHLISEVAKTVANYRKIVKKVSEKPSPDINAASNLVDLLESFTV